MTKQWEKGRKLQMLLEILISKYKKKFTSDFLIYAVYKRYLKWIKELNVGKVAIQLLEENIR